MTDSRLDLTPGVLIAMPSLIDPNFNRTAVLMLQHNDEGSLGLVLNRPTKHACAEVARSLDIEWEQSDQQVISVGGPVEPQSLWMVHPDEWVFDDSIQIGAGLAVSRSETALRQMCVAGEEKVRMFIGYAGWGPGQLEQEIKEGAWLVTDQTKNLVFQTPDTDIWTEALRQMGVDPGFLVSSTETLH